MKRTDFLVCALLSSVSAGFGADTGRWIPARWEGGPMEAARRANDQRFVEDNSLRRVISGWYAPSTLDLLSGTPINCLLVTFSAGLATDLEAHQQELVKRYGELARQRRISVLGLVYPGGDAAKIATAAVDTGLDGLVLDGEFAAGFMAQLEAGLHAHSSGALVVQIASNASSVRIAAPLVLVKGVAPSVRNLSDSGVRAGASAEPWIESNISLVRSFRLGGAWRPVWVDAKTESGSPEDYVRSVADAAIAGARWVISIDDNLRKQLFTKHPGALAAWNRMSEYLRFGEDHAEWRQFVPYGKVAIVLDRNSQNTHEYLNLTTRRQVPYRLIDRARLSAETLVGVSAVLAAQMAPATAAERKILCNFAESGGVVVAGASWGDAPKGEPYNEVPLGKGRVVVYPDQPPDPETVARDLKDLLEPEQIGFSVFNIPSGITYVSASSSGKPTLIQFLNYADRPNGRVTVRLNGSFKTSRLYTPEGGPVTLAVRPAGHDRVEIFIADPIRWGGLVLE
jgi:hypothetical protein